MPRSLAHQGIPHGAPRPLSSQLGPPLLPRLDQELCDGSATKHALGSDFLSWPGAFNNPLPTASAIAASDAWNEKGEERKTKKKKKTLNETEQIILQFNFPSPLIVVPVSC